MEKNRTLIIAEAGVNHNGDVNLACDLCDAAKASGADVVKFQTWKTEDLITHTVGQADYQKENTGVEESQFDMLKHLELPREDFRRIKKHCDEIGITFASTADEAGSMDFLMTLGIPFAKVGSGEMANIPYLRHIGSKHLPVLLSTGMSGLTEVELSIRALREGGADDITLLHCTTSYPCAPKDVNLRAMVTLREAFHLPVGYSDHTIGNEAAVAAVTLGATVIEKHFTLDRHMEGPDHVASTDPEGFRSLVEAIRRTELMLGSGIKQPTDDERMISGVVTKRIVASGPIAAGELLTEANICVKRHDHGALARYWDMMIGTRADRDLQPDDGIELR